MATVALTDRYLNSLKPLPRERIELSDAGCPGLVLRASHKGAKVWLLRYRGHDGRNARHRLGEYPAMTLKTARLEAGRLRELIENGGDPLHEKREAKEQARQDAVATFGKLIDAYWTACETGEWQPKRKRKRTSTLAYEKRLAERHIQPVLYDLPLSTIKRSTVKSLLREMVRKGITAQTNRVQAVIRQVYNFGISEELVEINPAMGFPPFHAQKPRLRIWKDQELRLLWRALTEPEPRKAIKSDEIFVGPQVRVALQLAMLLLQRRTEIVGMDLSELDLDQGVWRISPDRMKSGRPHQVPLPPYSVELIRKAITLSSLPSDRMSGPVFHDPRDTTKPMQPAALTRAMGRLRELIGVDDLTVHDLRRTGSTALTSERLRVSPLIRSKVLGHSSDTGGGAQVSSTHYDMNEYMVDKRSALKGWEALLLKIVSDGPARDSKPRHPIVMRTVMFGLEAANDPWPISSASH
ncbi:tyrosine-type recombinase/integrase [Brevundimonas nasdae]|uniref:Integrase family protein n=1 Tax=Brevundimonas nasdae TaxID=172043 RepID=A0ABX8TGQ5_9CAUL|nr:integrase arm-type DNA-binding domain-containing protein [Brevundimonas nasdae]QYC09283.1 integrase family protein [Brevundimonas nasdae]QYC15332.1 integrase family protein [Brevundimonas nasdae]